MDRADHAYGGRLRDDLLRCKWNRRLRILPSCSLSRGDGANDVLDLLRFVRCQRRVKPNICYSLPDFWTVVLIPVITRYAVTARIVVAAIDRIRMDGCSPRLAMATKSIEPASRKE